jgi:hypothetical protein
MNPPTSIARTNPDPLFTTEEAARFLGLSPGTMRNLRSQQRGPRYVRVLDRRVFYQRADLQRYVAERLIDPEAPR